MNLISMQHARDMVERAFYIQDPTPTVIKESLVVVKAARMKNTPGDFHRLVQFMPRQIVDLR